MLYENDYFSNDEGDVFVQVGGPGADVEYIPCVDVGDVARAKGDVNRELCPDPNYRGRWKLALRSKGASGEATFDLTVKLGRVMNALEDMSAKDCPAPLYILHRSCPPRNTFLPFDRADILPAGVLTNESMSNAGMSGSDGAAPTGATQTFSVSCSDWLKAFILASRRRTTVQIGNCTDIAWLKTSRCWNGGCGPALDPCDIGYITVGALAGASPVLVTANRGVTWASCAGATGFAVATGLNSVVVVDMGSDDHRVIVGRATIAATPNQIAYSDNGGANWVIVAVGAVNTEFVTGGGGLYAVDKDHIWCVTDTGGGAAGNIYFSDDGGLTWTLQDTGGDALNCVHFVNENVGLVGGDTNEVLLTVDGGDLWAAITGPAAQAAADVLSCAIWSKDHFMLGYDDGELWETLDGGDTWTQRTLTVPVGMTVIQGVKDIKYIDEQCIWLAIEANDGANDWAVIQRSIAGGEEGTWESFIAPVHNAATGGMFAIDPCSYNFCMGVGGVATTGMILEASNT